MEGEKRRWFESYSTAGDKAALEIRSWSQWAGLGMEKRSEEVAEVGRKPFLWQTRKSNQGRRSTDAVLTLMETVSQRGSGDGW